MYELWVVTDRETILNDESGEDRLGKMEISCLRKAQVPIGEEIRI